MSETSGGVLQGPVDMKLEKDDSLLETNNGVNTGINLGRLNGEANQTEKIVMVFRQTTSTSNRPK